MYYKVEMGCSGLRFVVTELTFPVSLAYVLLLRYWIVFVPPALLPSTGLCGLPLLVTVKFTFIHIFYPYIVCRQTIEDTHFIS